MKYKICFLSLICFAFLNCQSNLNDAKASEVIKTTFSLKDINLVSLHGISKDASDLFIVKFSIKSDIDSTEIQGRAKIRKYDKGWQFDGIQNKLNMYIEPSDYINSFKEREIDRQKSFLRIMNAKKDMEVLAKAIDKYIHDNGIAPNCGKGSEWGYGVLQKCLVPKYMEKAPEMYDQFGYFSGTMFNNHFSVPVGFGEGGSWGIANCKRTDYLLYLLQESSADYDGFNYNPKFPEAGIVSTKTLDEARNTIFLIFNGKWIRYPKLDFLKLPATNNSKSID